jgi:pimeloyl-ACP methyl ester carboxylesterase
MNRVNTHIFRLPDGHNIAYAEWGEPNGFPCLLFHGSPGSRLFGKSLDGPAKRAHLRLIAPDRPGFGRSDPVASYTIVGVAKDSLALMHALTSGHFAVAGVSGGAPYTYAAALLDPERTTVAAIISGLAPIAKDEPAGRNSKLVTAIRSDSERTLRMLRLQGRVLRRVIRIISRLPRAFRTPFNRAYAKHLPPADKAIMANSELAEHAMEDLAESLRQGKRSGVRRASRATPRAVGIRTERCEDARPALARNRRSERAVHNGTPRRRCAPELPSDVLRG